jgi:hypothetical protein
LTFATGFATEYQRLGQDVADINGMSVRLAVDDFKTILTEIRKLK